MSVAARVPVPRGARARERLLRAALEVLAERGMPGLTMEAIAQRAGASKATVYRHWRSPGTLLVDAMDLTFSPSPPPATGELRRDLVELLTGLEAMLRRQPFPRLLAAFMDGAERDPALQAMHTRLTERRRDLVREVLAAAASRGELPAGADLELAVDLLAGPAFYRRFVAHQPFPAGYAAAVVDHVLAALTAIAGRHPSTEPA